MSFIVRTRGEVRPSTTGTRPTSSTCRTSCGNWCASRPTCSPHPRNPSLAKAPGTGVPAASTTSRAPHGSGSRSSTTKTGPRAATAIFPTTSARRSNTARDSEPGQARPPHPRYPEPARDHGRATHRKAGQTYGPGHGILEQDARRDRGCRTGIQRNPTSRQGIGFRAHSQ